MIRIPIRNLLLLLETAVVGGGCNFASIMVGRKRNELMPNARKGEFDGAINLSSLLRRRRRLCRIIEMCISKISRFGPLHACSQPS